MGLQHALMGLGILVLLAVLAYGANRASRRRRQDRAAADAAIRGYFNSKGRGPTG
jgi:hypothetical protein